MSISGIPAAWETLLCPLHTGKPLVASSPGYLAGVYWKTCTRYLHQSGDTPPAIIIFLIAPSPFVLFVGYAGDPPQFPEEAPQQPGHQARKAADHLQP